MKPAIFGAVILYMQMACSTEQPSFSESRTSSGGPKSGDANASGGEGSGGEVIVGSAGNDGGADGAAGDGSSDGALDSDGGSDSGGVDAGGTDVGGADAGGADAGGMDAGDAGDAGGDGDGDGNGNEEITPPEEVIMNCANGVQKTKVVAISFPARQDCSWGTKQNDGNGNMTEVLSANGNLSIKDGWIRAREEQSAVVAVPANSLLCSIDMNSNTNTIHFDDFFALRIENFVVAASKVLANALTPDADGHYIWDWPRIRGNGSNGAGTQMQDIGKYCGTGDCSLPEHDMPGNFGVGFALDGTSGGMNAKLFSKLSNLSQMRFTTTATGDNDAQDCFHSGGAFTVTLKYVDKPN